MPMAEIHQFNHAAMATHFQARIAGEERAYAAQAAHHHQGAGGDAIRRGNFILGHPLMQQRWNAGEHVVGYP